MSCDGCHTWGDSRRVRTKEGPARGGGGRCEARRTSYLAAADALDLIADADALVASIRATLGEVKPVPVTLDTLNRSLRGSESSDEDMAAYIKAADQIREAFGCAVLVVHHCGVEARRPRGHTSLTGAADAQLAVKRIINSVISTTVEWMKDGPEGEMICSQLEALTVGTDQDGDDITSCVVVEAETPAIETRQSTVKLTPNQQTMLTVLQEAMSHGLTVEAWNEQAKDAGLCEGQKGQRRRFYDLRMQLKRKKLIHETQGTWYITPR